MERTVTEELADILFEQECSVSDVKIMPGIDPMASPDRVAKELWQSMERMGLIKDGKIVDRNAR